MNNSFNSRSREGATEWKDYMRVCIAVSIHAPVRERPDGGLRGWCTGRFNSRSREGATGIILVSFMFTMVSIHAPVRERQS